jgi:hypothetical protein
MLDAGDDLSCRTEPHSCFTPSMTAIRFGTGHKIGHTSAARKILLKTDPPADFPLALKTWDSSADACSIFPNGFSRKIRSRYNSEVPFGPMRRNVLS